MIINILIKKVYAVHYKEFYILDESLFSIIWDTKEPL